MCGSTFAPAEEEEATDSEEDNDDKCGDRDSSYGTRADAKIRSSQIESEGSRETCLP
jgi:hypothetical protein